MGYPAYQMLVEYSCKDCGINELDPMIIAKKQCPVCQCFMEVDEEPEFDSF